MQKNVNELKKIFMKSLAAHVDEQVDLQMNNNVWKRTITFNGLNLVTSVSNFSIRNAEEKRITKSVVSA